MSRSLWSLLIIVAVGLAVLLSSVFIVDERERALVVRFGEIERVIEKPGAYFKIPFIDQTVIVDNRILLWESEDKDVQVSDSRQYIVDTVTLVRVGNLQKFRESVGADFDLARAQIERRLDSALRQTYGKRPFDAALSKDRAVMMEEIRNQVRVEAIKTGIEVVDIRIRRTELPKDALDAAYAQMSSERLAEAKDLRGQGEATKIRIEAEADRKATEILSQAKMKAEIIRGEADAERNGIFAAAYNRDPEFFAFFRSMQAYKGAFGEKGTTFVLSPDSAFMRYFGDISGLPVAKPATP